MMIMKFGYVYVYYFVFCFVRARNRYTCWITPLHLNKKTQKMNRHHLGRNSVVFSQNSKFFLQNLMIILKINIILKASSTMQFFKFCLNQVLLLCSSYKIFILKIFLVSNIDNIWWVLLCCL